MTRAQMSQLKERVIEETRANKIQSIVGKIYSKSLYAAKNGLKTYEYQIPLDYDMQSKRLSSSNTFHVKYMNEILASLRELFPDSRVAHTLLAQGRDGRLYDIATMDDRVLPLVDSALSNSYIVVDWS